jgi:hypothetical protein
MVPAVLSANVCAVLSASTVRSLKVVSTLEKLLYIFHPVMFVFPFLASPAGMSLHLMVTKSSVGDGKLTPVGGKGPLDDKVLRTADLVPTPSALKAAT